ncbi:NADH-quinone oxidoreductase subunit I, partial [Arcicella aurantiaca]
MKKGANNTYFGNIKEGIKSSLKGLSLSWRHLKEARQSRKPIFVDNPDYFKQQTGIVTLQYPHEQLPLPDNGRYQLDNEMDDCIVCDKCAKVCPVDCIEIEPIKATGIAGYASDGSAIRLYAAKFDIDMAKCMFCGLCTTVCPTECLTMTHEYDFSTFDVKNHNFEFGNLTAEQSQEKRDLYEQFMAEKEAMKLASKVKSVENKVQVIDNREQSLENREQVIDNREVKAEETPKPKPAFKPAFKKPVVSEEKTEQVAENKEQVIENREQSLENREVKAEDAPKPKPAFKPAFKKPVVSEDKPEVVENIEAEAEEVPKPKPVFKPKFTKPVVSEEKTEVVENIEAEGEEAPKPKPVFKPKFTKPVDIDNREQSLENSEVKA